MAGQRVTLQITENLFHQFFITLLKIIYKLWRCPNCSFGVTEDASKIITVKVIAFNSLSVQIVEPGDTHKYVLKGF